MKAQCASPAQYRMPYSPPGASKRFSPCPSKVQGLLTLPRLKHMGFSFLLCTPHRASGVPSLRTAIDRAPWHRRRHYSATLLKHQGAGRADPPAHIPAGVVIGVSPIPAARAAESLPLASANRPAATARLARVG